MLLVFGIRLGCAFGFCLLFGLDWFRFMFADYLLCFVVFFIVCWLFDLGC